MKTKNICAVGVRDITPLKVREAMASFKNYSYDSKNIEGEWYVVANGNGSEELKICKITKLKHPKAVATAIADSLNRNTKLLLVDLI